MSTEPTSFDGPSDPDEEVPRCTFSEEEGHLCTEEARWLVVWNGDESVSVECCEKHLHLILTNATEYVVYPNAWTVQAEGEWEEDFVDPELGVSAEGPALQSLSTEERFTCPQRVQMTDGYSETNIDFWEHRNFEHFQRCSYCGSVRPEDAVGLLRTGWTLRETDKTFKYVLVPTAGDAKNYTTPQKVYRQHFGADDVTFAAFLSAGFGGQWYKVAGRWVRRDKSDKPQQAYIYGTRANSR